jgi:hypothetical protein
MGSLFSAVGSIAQGNAAGAASAYQAQVAANNAQIEAQNANYAAEAGAVQSNNQSLVNRGQAGRLKANQAASGIDVNTGSALATQISQRETGLENVQTINANTARQVYGYRTQQTADLAQSQLENAQSGQEETGGIFGAAGSLIGGIGQPGNSPSAFLQNAGSNLSDFGDSANQAFNFVFS